MTQCVYHILTHRIYPIFASVSRPVRVWACLVVYTLEYILAFVLSWAERIVVDNVALLELGFELFGSERFLRHCVFLRLCKVRALNVEHRFWSRATA